MVFNRHKTRKMMIIKQNTSHGSTSRSPAWPAPSVPTADAKYQRGGLTVDHRVNMMVPNSSRGPRLIILMVLSGAGRRQVKSNFSPTPVPHGVQTQTTRDISSCPTAFHNVTPPGGSCGKGKPESLSWPTVGRGPSTVNGWTHMVLTSCLCGLTQHGTRMTAPGMFSYSSRAPVSPLVLVLRVGFPSQLLR